MSEGFIAPLRIECEIEGVAIVFTPLTVGETLRLLPVAERCMGALVSLPDELLDRLETNTLTPPDMAVLGSMLAEHGPQLVQALAIASRQPVAWINALLFDRLVELLVLVIQVNKDFFVRAMPGIQARVATLAQAQRSPSAGPSASSSSSPTAIATTTS